MSIFYLILFSLCFSQNIYTDYLVISSDTIDVFSYQIPELYDGSISSPLLLTFHQWGGNENSNYCTKDSCASGLTCYNQPSMEEVTDTNYRNYRNINKRIRT